MAQTKRYSKRISPVITDNQLDQLVAVAGQREISVSEAARLSLRLGTAALPSEPKLTRLAVLLDLALEEVMRRVLEAGLSVVERDHAAQPSPM